MKRHELKELKRAAARRDAGAMDALLRRSIRFGHKRLALLRGLQAERMGVPMDEATLRYCEQVAAQLDPEEIARLVRQAWNRSA